MCGSVEYHKNIVTGSISGYQKQLHSIGKHSNRESEKGANGRVGIELIIEYEDGSEETRFVELY